MGNAMVKKFETGEEELFFMLDYTNLYLDLYFGLAS